MFQKLPSHPFLGWAFKPVNLGTINCAFIFWQWMISEPWPEKLVSAGPNGWPKREMTNPSQLRTLSKPQFGFMPLAPLSQGSLSPTLFQAPKSTFFCKREMKKEALRLSFDSLPTAALGKCSSRESNPSAKTSSTPCQEKGQPAWWLSGPTVVAICQNSACFSILLCYTCINLEWTKYL